MTHERTIKKIEKTLFSGDDKLKMTDKEIEIRKRYMSLFHLMIERPAQKDTHLVNFLMQTFGVGRSQAFADVGNVKIIFGKVQKTAKEWDRYVVTEMLKEAYEKAKEKEDIKNMIYASDKLGRYTKLDQEDGRDIPWEEIQPMDIEPTGDVGVLGLKSIPNLRKKQKELRQKYGKMEEAIIVDDDE